MMLPDIEVPDLNQPVAAVLQPLFERRTIGTRTRNALSNEGIVTLADLVAKTDFELLRIPNLGKRSVMAVKATLRRHGLALSGEVAAVAPVRARNWYAMFTAPRDGTRVIAILSDFSGVHMVRWGKHQSQQGEAWFYTDWHDEVGGDEAFAGWIPVPEGTPEYKMGSQQ